MEEWHRVGSCGGATIGMSFGDTEWHSRANASDQGIATASGLWTTSPSFKNAPGNPEIVTENNGITYDEVQKHKSADDCWVIIDVSKGWIFDTMAMAADDGERAWCTT